MVTVDGKSQNAKQRRSRLELFGTSPGVEVIQASADAYAECSEYRRTCALVRLPEGGNYVVDLFRVQGGRLHQYGLNCNGRFLGLDGVEPVPIDEQIRWLANLRAVQKPPEVWNAAWEQPGRGVAGRDSIPSGSGRSPNLLGCRPQVPKWRSRHRAASAPRGGWPASESPR